MAPSNLGWDEIHVGITLTTMATVAVVLRLIARVVKKLRLELDDWFAISSLVFIYAMFVELVLWAAIGNSGKHIETLQPLEISEFFKIFLSQEYTYAITSPLVKLTFLFFYRRIFAVPTFRLAANVLVAVCIAWGATTVIVDSVQCVPLEAYWNITIKGKCISEVKFVQGIQGINVALDLAIFIMPMPMVWGLQRPWKDRLALLMVFLLGGFICGASIYRFVALFQINAADITFSIHNAIVWTFVEPCVGLVCACLPVIRGLLPSYNKIVSKYSKGSSNSNPSSGRGWYSSQRSYGADYIEMHDSRLVKEEDKVDEAVGDRTDRRIYVKTSMEIA